ncbi:MAG: helix-turn-helix transcriptional regulator [Acidobacteria bacterium]|nr:helix-turn-helix transcriptional regulator [Acidobacteriota bacterium]
MKEDALARHIADNIRQLRQSRNLTQDQLARLSGVPRPTWSNLESGTANPTVSVLAKVAAALQVPVEELISPPKAQAKLFRAKSIAQKQRGGVLIRKLLPDHLQGMELDRMEFAPGAHMAGVPHRLGTREYLACESGQIELVVAGEKYELAAGDVVVFRGDQKHSYANRSATVAVAYSAIILGPGRIA